MPARDVPRYRRTSEEKSIVHILSAPKLQPLSESEMKSPITFKTKAPRFLYAVFANGGNIVSQSVAHRKFEAVDRFMALRPRYEWSQLCFPKGAYKVQKFEVKLCRQ